LIVVHQRKRQPKYEGNRKGEWPRREMSIRVNVKDRKRDNEVERE
jgi:hypothetical protein